MDTWRPYSWRPGGRPPLDISTAWMDSVDSSDYAIAGGIARIRPYALPRINHSDLTTHRITRRKDLMEHRSRLSADQAIAKSHLRPISTTEALYNLYLNPQKPSYSTPARIYPVRFGAVSGRRVPVALDYLDVDEEDWVRKPRVYITEHDKIQPHITSRYLKYRNRKEPLDSLKRIFKGPTQAPTWTSSSRPISDLGTRRNVLVNYHTTPSTSAVAQDVTTHSSRRKPRYTEETSETKEKSPPPRRVVQQEEEKPKEKEKSPEVEKKRPLSFTAKEENEEAPSGEVTIKFPSKKEPQVTERSPTPPPVQVTVQLKARKSSSASPSVEGLVNGPEFPPTPSEDQEASFTLHTSKPTEPEPETPTKAKKSALAGKKKPKDPEPENIDAAAPPPTEKPADIPTTPTTTAAPTIKKKDLKTKKVDEKEAGKVATAPPSAVETSSVSAKDEQPPAAAPAPAPAPAEPEPKPKPVEPEPKPEPPKSKSKPVAEPPKPVEEIAKPVAEPEPVSVPEEQPIAPPKEEPVVPTPAPKSPTPPPTPVQEEPEPPAPQVVEEVAASPVPAAAESEPEPAQPEPVVTEPTSPLLTVDGSEEHKSITNGSVVIKEAEDTIAEVPEEEADDVKTTTTAGRPTTADNDEQAEVSAAAVEAAAEEEITITTTTTTLQGEEEPLDQKLDDVTTVADQVEEKEEETITPATPDRDADVDDVWQNYDEMDDYRRRRPVAQVVDDSDCGAPEQEEEPQQEQQEQQPEEQLQTDCAFDNNTMDVLVLNGNQDDDCHLLSPSPLDAGALSDDTCGRKEDLLLGDDSAGGACPGIVVDAVDEDTDPDVDVDDVFGNENDTDSRQTSVVKGDAQEYLLSILESANIRKIEFAKLLEEHAEIVHEIEKYEAGIITSPIQL